MNLVRITTTVNGVRYERDVEARLTLVDFLREELDLVGTHVGCGFRSSSDVALISIPGVQ